MKNTFTNDIKKGLTAKNKFIPDRDYYDDRGSVYFQELMHNPDYYVYNSELEILETYKNDIIDIFNKNTKRFNLIEFGAGDGIKTELLINELINNNINFNYIPIDFSKKYIDDMELSFKKKFTSLNIKGINADYFDALEQIANKNTKNIILFIGSSFGGLTDIEADEFLSKVSSKMKKDDILFIGFDLKKSPTILYKAYHNTCFDWCNYLLSRINNELGGNIDLSKFEYYTNYNPINGKFKWYFLSKIKQNIYIKDIDLNVSFDKSEPIYIGQSKKFSETEIISLSEKYNFKSINNYTDSNKYFIDSVWIK